ncbi:thiopurine S-methyltransferase [Kangiella sediminilitoris]|uniref:Thiopurine S-methyltransferase n=1 Tax=Kangiella sediminilitoris TaxID=1144748 RepID=A0A1B3BC47_9GAMM|nr:thiopurine S-methyltransferase [Kangiella sediminilitoris]AOE50376.1 Thiopurine S-methyltransferase [Kangiella sediminilitoris]
MDPSFWQDKWHSREIGFHQGHANALLIKYFPSLRLHPGSRIFVPLCGKTHDIHWLLSKGCHVVGVELSETAIKELFEELNLEPSVTSSENLTHYQADRIDIFAGDIFELNADTLGAVDAVYDRAALVALPESMRKDYSQQVESITYKAPQLLITFEYDQNALSGPPFAISESMLKSYYEASYGIELLETEHVEGGLKGEVEAKESIWLLSPAN